MPSKPNEPADAADASPSSGKASTNTVKDSAQQIWLAGLGAFAKAQEEGSKVFEALVKEGLGMQRKTQAAATEATSKMATMANITGLANGIGGLGGLSAKAAAPWDKLENIFEDRVAKALSKLGMPSAQDMQTLIARVEELNRNVLALSRPAPAAKAASRARAAGTPKPLTKPARKATSKPAASAKD